MERTVHSCWQDKAVQWCLAHCYGAFLVFTAYLWLLASPAINAQPSIQTPATYSAAVVLAKPTRQAVVLDAQTLELDVIQHASYWIDDQNTSSPATTLGDMLAKANAGQAVFRPAEAASSHHINGKVLWWQFSLQASDLQARWLLELGSPLVDDVRLYWRGADGQWLSLSSGDVVPRKLWPLPTRLPTFALNTLSSAPTTYFLRVENARFPVSFPMTIYRDSVYLKAHQAEQMLLGAFAGMLSLILLTSFVYAAARREQSLVALSVYSLALGLFGLANTGLAPLYIWNDSPILADRLNYVFAALTAAIGPWLVRSVVRPVIRFRLTNILLASLSVALIFCAALELYFPTMASYRLLNLATFAAIVYVYSMIALTWQRQETITRWVALCFAPVTLAAMPMVLRNLGAMPDNWLTAYGVPVAALIELPLLLFVLLGRSNTRRETIARTAGLPTKDALTGLPNMPRFLHHFGGSIRRAERFGHSYGLLLVELTNYGWYVKEHGSNMADRALILTSTRLQQQVREVDMVCRLDASNFVIVVEGACTPTQLTKLAARISASAQAPGSILPVGAALRLSICCALMPTSDSQTAGEDAHSQLAWMIAAAEATPVAQRKLVRSVGF